MGAAFFITLREGLEAALIVAIVMAYLRQLGRTKEFSWVFLGAIAGVAVSLVAGTGVYIAVGELEGRAEQLTEGIIALAAVAVLTWMIFWMRRQARTLGGDLRKRVDQSLAGGTVLGLSSIVFIGVVREGLETALFLLAVVFDSSATSTAIGAFSGLALAIVLGYLIYRGGERINLRLFFQITGGVIIVVAAGLLAKGVHELQEAGVLDTLYAPVWDVGSNPIIGHGQFTNFLKGFLGWSPDPSIEQLAAWAIYIVVASWFFFWNGRLPSVAQGPRTDGASVRAEPEQSSSA
ncbi:MAG: FTR1 family protein [Chloroflexi bacterium]|nr:FTR1 family protein [Chloroflexota bacterium]